MICGAIFDIVRIARKRSIASARCDDNFDLLLPEALDGIRGDGNAPLPLDRFVEDGDLHDCTFPISAGTLHQIEEGRDRLNERLKSVGRRPQKLRRIYVAFAALARADRFLR